MSFTTATNLNSRVTLDRTDTTSVVPLLQDPTDGAVPPPPIPRRKGRRKPPRPPTPEEEEEEEESEEEESDSESDSEEDSDDDCDRPKPLRPGKRLSKGKRGKRQKKALKYLGWSKKEWKRKEIPEELIDLEWDDLTRKQKSAAKYLCYDEDSWNEQYCEDSGDSDDSY